ncbi:magnesium/cobalt transporter CorA [Pontibacter sp. 172403-2]|uniref:magnesium/cobalt transporter CorA n=1 Tax=Pontibacter rufus TaxID=2791028 RepID=UPI0018AFCDFA|nr:magnesium/cobalt transporter CorA [Pontibacter sp. 172403-2]MBF9252332.1 magnesium/cobalt transporter CorA [Pontibacter sp. 172403-2]
MSKRKHHRHRNSILNRTAGTRPGFLFVPAGAHAPRFFLVSFSDTFLEQTELPSYELLMKKVSDQPDLRHWIDIRGYGDLKLLEQITLDFSIHPLQMEDVINDYQRPKVVEQDRNRLFIISRMLRWSAETHCLDDVQLSIFTGPNYVLTLQSDYEDCLDQLRERIRVGKGLIRSRPTMYLAYAIMDVILDYYFPVMNEIGNYIEELERHILQEASKQTLSDILGLKNELVKLRRIAWPERDKLNEMLRLDEEMLPDSLRVYFHDAYDHVVQLIDLIDNQKETASSLVELYMSTVSNRMNEIMKVLTIISSIFIPLSFIVGLYGMNFAHENPETGKVYPLSMPELYQPYAYPVLLVLMLSLICLQLYFFYRKGWLRSF